MYSVAAFPLVTFAARFEVVSFRSNDSGVSVSLFPELVTYVLFARKELLAKEKV